MLARTVDHAQMLGTAALHRSIFENLGYGPIFDTDTNNAALVDELTRVAGASLPEEYVPFGLRDRLAA